jgi:regulator of sigma E protease
MDIVFNIFIFVLLISFLIVVHELGHLLFAKLFNVYCYEFSVGFGPRLLSKKVGETYYSIKALPLGGAVAMAGEEFDPSEAKEMTDPIYRVEVPPERTLLKIAKWKRLIVMAAGATFNIILGYILLIFAIAIGGVGETKSIVDVDKNSIAYISGLRSGDQIDNLKIEYDEAGMPTICINEAISTFAELNDNFSKCSLKEKKQLTYTFSVAGKGETIITRDCLGESCEDTPLIGLSQHIRGANFGEYFTVSFSRFINYSTQIFNALIHLFTPAGISGVSGPVGIFSLSSQVVKYGFVTYLNFASLLTINLGIFNLIPFPALDGSLIFITAGEMITRKELPNKIKNIISYSGLLILFSLIILITIKDIISFT